MTGERRSLATICLLITALAVPAGCGQKPPPAPKPAAPPPSRAAAEKKPDPDSATQAAAPYPAPSGTTPSPEPPKAPEGPAPAGAEKQLRRVRLLISGRVQGVGFRAFTTSKASALGLTGTVRNLADGRVEAVVEGPAGKVEELIKAVGIGPTGARVEGVLTEEQSHRGEFRAFTIGR